MVLDRLELAERDRRVRRVLAVGGEQPRVVGVAGADERDAVQRADRARVGLAAIDEAISLFRSMRIFFQI